MAFNWELITKDFQQKYEQSFVRVKIDDVFEVFWIERVSRGDPPYINLVNPKRGVIQLNYTTDFEISFGYPEIGMFNFGDRIACGFFRKYNRQWKRGISTSTSIILCGYNEFYHIVSDEPDYKILFDAFKPRQVITIAEAVSRDCLSTCLNNYFSLGLDIKPGNKRILWYINSPIGWWEKDTIILRELQFKQELMDYFRDSGEYHDVVIRNN